MPVPAVTSGKNIWVAAGDGDLERVKELVGLVGVSPNVPDSNTYTPMHAAASYGQLDVLEYLIQHGGDVNVTDEDGDTPLFTVENVETAEFLVEHGAIWDIRNNEGISPAEHLSEDYAEVAHYLESLAPEGTVDTIPTQPPPTAEDMGPIVPSDHLTELTAHNLTTELMDRVNDIMRRAEVEGRDPEEELKSAVGETFMQGMRMGTNWGQEAREDEDSDDMDDGGKRVRR